MSSLRYPARAVAAIVTVALSLAMRVQAGQPPVPIHAQADRSRLKTGDVLLYDLTIEQQVHEQRESQSGPPPQGAVSRFREGAAQGTARFEILGVDASGFARARVSIDTTRQAGIHRWHAVNGYFAAIAPSGVITPDPTLGMEVDEITSFADIAARDFAAAPMHVGTNRASAERLPGDPVVFKIIARIVGLRGGSWPTFVIAADGEGLFKNTIVSHVADGRASLSGTSYYDEKDRLIVGSAMRSLLIFDVDGRHGPHIDATTSLKLMLRSITHAQPPVPLPAAMHRTRIAPPRDGASAAEPRKAPPGVPQISPNPSPYGSTATPSVPEPAPTVSPGES
ncbi:MAG: hypothetical protein GIX02_14570 [Candidatus Eremiobacteraeota bacterium]|nr:hypothetical protein [Candidatus Eremiobacteraeota bacterium]